MRNRRWIYSWLCNCFIASVAAASNAEEPTTIHNANSTKELRGLFSPRMDYDRWKPLGRGDPLKNDPTYDYVPPVLERVHYWIDPALRKPDPPLPDNNQKTEILLLGVSSKRPSTASSINDRKDSYDSFMKFVEGPKFNRPRVPRPHYGLPASYYPSMFFSSKTKYQEKPGVGKGEQQRVPYTMLMPPPVHNPDESYVKTTDGTTVSSSTSTSSTEASDVTIQESNLIYHSSSLSNKQEWLNKDVLGGLGESSSHVTWRSPTLDPVNFTETKMTRTDENKVIESSVIRSREPGFYVKMHYKTHMNTSGNFVTLPPFDKDHQVMHKGQVSDDSMDIASTYVNIGKPEAQVHPPTGLDISGIQIPSPNMIRESPIVMNTPPQPINMMMPMTLETLETMQTMQPPPVLITMEPPPNTLQALLQKEATQPVSFTTNEIFETTTATTTTTSGSLTTDPLFKHYKQPAEPLKGPMYLIIQGHSKVKTYGPSKQLHGISIQETNEIPTSDEYSIVKHLHGYKKESPEETKREGRSGNLQTLTHVVQTGLGAIDFPEFEGNRRKDEDVQEAELVVRYDVASRRDVTSEKYYKGIVESGDVSRKLKDSGN